MRCLLPGLPGRDCTPLRVPIELFTVDDDLGGPYAPVPGDTVATTLAALGVRQGAGGSRVVMAFAEPRAWKGRAGFSAASRAALEELVPGSDLVVLFGHPRLVGEIPGTGPVHGGMAPPAADAGRGRPLAQ